MNGWWRNTECQERDQRKGRKRLVDGIGGEYRKISREGPRDMLDNVLSLDHMVRNISECNSDTAIT